jgi:hypothetical protein
MTAIYLDHSSATPILPAILPELTRLLREYGNPASMHGLGQAAKEAVEQVRHQVQTHMGGFWSVLLSMPVFEQQRMNWPPMGWMFTLFPCCPRALWIWMH